MQNKQALTLHKISVAAAFLLMVIINGVGNLLPLNAQSTGQVSDAYPNIFAPAGFTFAVWGVIYFLLACYTLYQFGLFQKVENKPDSKLMKTIGRFFIISSLANAAWIFCWHFHLIPVSMLMMAVILICLIIINRVILKAELSGRDKLFLRLPFSIYFGWITVATIANATVLLVSLGWNAFGISETVWASAIIAIGLLIGSTTMLKHKDIAYGLVLIWAYLGILIKHITASEFNSQYPAVIVTVIACMVLFAAAAVYTVVSGRKKQTLNDANPSV